MSKKQVRYGQKPAAAKPPMRGQGQVTPQPVQPPRQPAGPPPEPGQRPPSPPSAAAAAAMVNAKPNVTPQQQAAYAAFVNDCYRILFNPQAFPATLKMIGAHGNPVQGLATAVVMVVMQVQENYQKQRQPLTPSTILLHGALELLRTTAQAAQQAQLHTFTPQEMAQASAQAISLYQQQAQKAGLFNAAQAQQQAAAFPPNAVFAPVLARDGLSKMVSQAPGKQGRGAPQPQQPAGPQPQPGAPPAAGQPQTSGLLSQGAQ